MKKLIGLTLKKVPILKILNCHFSPFPMVKVEFGSRGITIQESCDERGMLANTFIPRSSIENYDCQEPVAIAIPKCIRQMGGKCVKIEILRVDSWRVKSIFKSDNGVSYEVPSHTMHKMSPLSYLDSGISFDRYITARKCFGGGDVEVSVSNGSASFKGGRISSFTIGEKGEPYCKIPGDRLKLLNKFLGATITNSKMEFCKKDEEFLFSIENDYYRIDIRLTTTKV